MKYKVKAFGIARDILGAKEVSLEVKGNQVADLRKHLSMHYPALNDLNSLLIAVNLNYAGDDIELHESDEIVLIPPVSGG
jgi:molybdopterin converting factor subunit 1